jgi:hypothetical protein
VALVLISNYLVSMNIFFYLCLTLRDSTGKSGKVSGDLKNLHQIPPTLGQNIKHTTIIRWGTNPTEILVRCIKFRQSDGETSGEGGTTGYPKHSVVSSRIFFEMLPETV